MKRLGNGRIVGIRERSDEMAKRKVGDWERGD